MPSNLFPKTLEIKGFRRTLPNHPDVSERITKTRLCFIMKSALKATKKVQSLKFKVQSQALLLTLNLEF
jgi:hypothetical protein